MESSMESILEETFMDWCQNTWQNSAVPKRTNADMSRICFPADENRC